MQSPRKTSHKRRRSPSSPQLSRPQKRVFSRGGPTPILPVGKLGNAFDYISATENLQLASPHLGGTLTLGPSIDNEDGYNSQMSMDRDDDAMVVSDSEKSPSRVFSPMSQSTSTTTPIELPTYSSVYHHGPQAFYTPPQQPLNTPNGVPPGLFIDTSSYRIQAEAPMESAQSFSAYTAAPPLGMSPLPHPDPSSVLPSVSAAKKKMTMGPRTDCEKCRLKVPGHWNHYS